MTQKQIGYWLCGFFPIFERMDTVQTEMFSQFTMQVRSEHLDRPVIVDLYLPPAPLQTPVYLLLVNDGQDLLKMDFRGMLLAAGRTAPDKPLLAVGIHAGLQRKLEYGTARSPDYLGRGRLAKAYGCFVLEELLPAIYRQLGGRPVAAQAFAGFSLGGLSALDIVWSQPALFSRVGVFSGSLWWRSLDTNDPAYDDKRHRILHQVIDSSAYQPGLRFFFECGTLDETADRNHNGVIDSIDDTRDMIAALIEKGYDPARDISYLEIEGGRHDVATWEKAFPSFLDWWLTS